MSLLSTGVLRICYFYLFCSLTTYWQQAPVVYSLSVLPSLACVILVYMVYMMGGHIIIPFHCTVGYDWVTTQVSYAMVCLIFRLCMHYQGGYSCVAISSQGIRDGAILNIIVKRQHSTRQYWYQQSLVLSDNIEKTIILVLSYTHNKPALLQLSTHPVYSHSLNNVSLCKVCTC